MILDRAVNAASKGKLFSEKENVPKHVRLRIEQMSAIKTGLIDITDVRMIKLNTSCNDCNKMKQTKTFLLAFYFIAAKEII